MGGTAVEELGAFRLVLGDSATAVALAGLAAAAAAALAALLASPSLRSCWKHE